ncbi:MAG: DNA repair protein RecN [Candidatus Gallimonas sp.]
MLEKLIIRNVALIERAEIEFTEGLNVLSGETGAGKSVILDSIDFVLGAKADKSMIRYGADECSVRAEFRPGKERATVSEILSELDVEEDETLVITRKFSADGKSSIKLNGCSVTVAMLRKVTQTLVDIHGQSEHFYLLKESNQLRLLDKIAGTPVSEAKKRVGELISERKRILSDLARLGGDEGERDRRLDVLRYQIEEIGRAELREGEEEELLQKRERAANAEKIVEGLRSATESLSADGAAVDAVRTAQRALAAIARYDEKYGELAERLESVGADLSDAADSAERFCEDVDLDEREAERVENRLDEIRLLKKKYGGSYAAIVAFYDRAKEEAELLSDSGERFERLTSERKKTDAALYAACRALTEARKKAAQVFSERVTAELKTLNVASAQFEVRFSEYGEEDVERANADGLDGVRYLFSANAGEPLKEMGKIISGGEMSRFMLAVKAQLSSVNEIGTYLFDEIDAGISGKTARVVAEKFCKIARTTQIVAVSHLAQIAACADGQFLIEKRQTDGKTVTEITRLDESGRKREIVRLLGGDSDSEAANGHAEELLRNAEIYKNSLS